MTNRALLGKRANGNYGLFVSGAGVNADTAADNDLVFSSTWASTASIHASGLIANTYAETTVLFPALPYIPLAIVGYYHAPTNNYYGYMWSGGYVGDIYIADTLPVFKVYTDKIIIRGGPVTGLGIPDVSHVKYSVLRVAGDG